jgi:chemotaxis protein methyltransferase CheR
MNVADFELIAELLKERSGLALNNRKAYLLESQLNPVAHKWNFTGIEELAQAIGNNNDEALPVDMTEAMMTNASFFFRDRKPFEQFTSIVLPRRTPKGPRPRVKNRQPFKQPVTGPTRSPSYS